MTSDNRPLNSVACDACGTHLIIDGAGGLDCPNRECPDNVHMRAALRKAFPNLAKGGKTMTVRAKLRLTGINTYKWGKDAPPYQTLRFEAQYDDKIPEDQRFQKATPSGHCELQIDNPAALAQFEHGKAYYVDFTPADE